MRWSRTIIPTLKEDPQEAEIDSHKLLLRAGMIRKLSSGLYTYLPLGLRALLKVENIVREEMDRSGALELRMPILQPRELWERSGRWRVMEEIMLGFKSRQGREMVLGPTHEEVVTELVSREISSYRQVPLNLYQIGPKFRDELRPRFGLVRCKEFVMKDAYSFDLTAEEAEKSYRLMYDAYLRVFSRCGLKVEAVEADTGMMGGTLSHEFMVPAPAGEDGIASCSACGYAANLERAERRPPEAVVPTGERLEVVDTPGLKSVQELAGFFSASPERFIKTLIYQAGGSTVGVLIRGDRQVNESKLRRLLGVEEVVLAGEDAIRRATGAALGFSGPVGLKNLRLVSDYSVRTIADGITGANQDDRHLVHVNWERDCEIESFADLAVAASGDSCPRCAGPLVLARGIEVGHTFKLGDKYSRALGALVKDENGEERPLVMGCYGIGISRLVAAIVEQNHDGRGIVWPPAVAPYQVALLAVNPDDEVVSRAGEIYRQLTDVGMEVLYDDRPVSAGVKFNDSDLIGLPFRVVVGKNFLKTGRVELKARAEEQADSFSPAEIPDRLREKLAAASIPPASVCGRGGQNDDL